jgi:hypothetical protein
MQLLSILRRVGEAFLTAVAVVFGLIPDPTRVPVEIPLDDRCYRRY